MNKNHRVLLQQVFDHVQENHLDSSCIAAKDLIAGIKKLDTEQRVPWKTFRPYMTTEGIYNFADLFKEELDMSVSLKETYEFNEPAEVTMPESFTFGKAEELEEKEEAKEEEETVAEETEEISEPLEVFKRKPKVRKIANIPESKKAPFKDPVYVVESVDCSNEYRVVGIARSFASAWDNLLYQAIHDNGTTSYEDAEVQAETTGHVLIKSIHSNNLCCLITKKELI